jgi:hypothetical protein
MIIKSYKSKITVRFHFTPVRMAISRIQTTNVGKNVGKEEPSYTVGGTVN